MGEAERIDDEKLRRLHTAEARICRHFGWDNMSGSILTAVHAIGQFCAIPLGVDQAEQIADALEKKEPELREMLADLGYVRDDKGWRKRE